MPELAIYADGELTEKIDLSPYSHGQLHELFGKHFTIGQASNYTTSTAGRALAASATPLRNDAASPNPPGRQAADAHAKLHAAVDDDTEPDYVQEMLRPTIPTSVHVIIGVIASAVLLMGLVRCLSAVSRKSTERSARIKAAAAAEDGPVSHVA